MWLQLLSGWVMGKTEQKTFNAEALALGSGDEDDTGQATVGVTLRSLQMYSLPKLMSYIT